MRVTLRLGWNATPLREQLRRDDADVAQWQYLADAITALRHEELLTHVAAQRARRRLAVLIADAHTKRKAA